MSSLAPAPVRWPLLRLLALGRPVRATIALAVVAGAATVGCAVALLATSGFLLARASQHPNVVALSIAVVAVRALGIGRGLSRYVERLSGHDAALRVLADLRASVYERLERVSPGGVASLRSGDLVSRFVADVDAVQDLFIRGIAPPAVAALIGGLTVVFAVAVSVPGGAVLGLGLLLAGVGLPVAAVALGHRASAAMATIRGELASATVDVVDGAAELIAYGAAPAALARLEDCDTRLTGLARRSAAANALGMGGATLISGVTVFAVLLSGVAAVHRGSLTAIPLAVLVLTALAAFEVTAPLPAAAIQLASARASARRVFAIVDAPAPVDEPLQPVPIPGGAITARLSGVTARYPDSSRDALVDVDLELPPGKRIGVIGPSGAGKSTLAAVLLRFVEVASGSFTINGVDARALASDDVRRLIGGCVADPHVFDSTLRENLRLARPGADDDALYGVLATVRLDEWVASLPAGLNARVGARGAAMSGGQRQRLALARALLSDPAILVLDEPTAHLDAQTADEVMRDVLILTRGRATILITHDEHGMDEMDEIVELVDGRIAPSG
jgi:ATP-binding cassette, subfamily C, bacterial CydC